MCQLLESIRIENHTLQHIDLHNKRFNEARRALYGLHNTVMLEDLIELPTNIGNQRYKCRVLTNGETFDVEIKPYHQREIKTLIVIRFDEIEYTYKTTNRALLDQAFALRQNCDDIIIVKNDKVTDAWAANLIFFNGEKWVTPSTPLLKGIQREYLLSTGKIFEQNIYSADIKNFEKIKLINAMIDLDQANEINVKTNVFGDIFS
jgi:4-amino-4-deoxychorismate lyase